MNCVHNHWLVCQIGAREHYAIARALHSVQIPVTLLTDYWSGGRKWGIPPRLAQRYHAELADINVIGFNSAYMRFVASAKWKRLRHWDEIVAKNHWFQRRATEQLVLQCDRLAAPSVVFAYSYAARDLFQTAKRSGCTTLLGQIDPGPVETRLVRSLRDQAGFPPLLEPPPRYWDYWHQECELADGIVVNSTWSRDALVSEGISAEKICVIPLVYENAAERNGLPYAAATEFTAAKPLKVLFLGQVIHRKGASELLGAIESMKDEAVHWTVVGPGDSDLIHRFRRACNTTVVGPVKRSDTSGYYQDADVFILPTHSDGFAITQLEAAFYGLPLIASRFCGDVITPNYNGIVLEDVTTAAIVAAVRQLLTAPAKLRRMAKHQSQTQHRSLSALADHLRSAADRASALRSRSTEDFS